MKQETHMTQMKHLKLHRVLLAAGLALWLTACGDGPVAELPPPPQAASKMPSTTSILTSIKRVFIFTTPPEF